MWLMLLISYHLNTPKKMDQETYDKKAALIEAEACEIKDQLMLGDSEQALELIVNFSFNKVI